MWGIQQILVFFYLIHICFQRRHRGHAFTRIAANASDVFLHSWAVCANYRQFITDRLKFSLKVAAEAIKHILQCVGNGVVLFIALAAARWATITPCNGPDAQFVHTWSANKGRSLYCRWASIFFLKAGEMERGFASTAFGKNLRSFLSYIAARLIMFWSACWWHLGCKQIAVSQSAEALGPWWQLVYACVRCADVRGAANSICVVCVRFSIALRCVCWRYTIFGCVDVAPNLLDIDEIVFLGLFLSQPTFDSTKHEQFPLESTLNFLFVNLNNF